MASRIQSSRKQPKGLEKQPGGVLRFAGKGQVPLERQQAFVDLHREARNQDAHACAESLVADFPAAAFAWKALGSSLLRAQRLTEAEEALLHAVSLNSSDPELHNNLGHVYEALEREEDAIRCMQKALELRPDFPQPLDWIVRLLNDKARYAESLTYLDRALALRPDDVGFRSKKATALLRNGRFTDAAAIFEGLAEEKPDDACIVHSLGNALYNLGRFDEAEAAIRRSLELAPNNFVFYSDYLLQMHYNPANDADAIRAAHLEWDRRFRPALVRREAGADLDPDRRLRIGMISAGFRIHPVGQMIASALTFLHPDDLEIFAYTMNDKVDPYTQVIQKRVDRWQSVIRLSNEELDARIREDRIDILIDLCGHTEGTRSMVMAMEPAPLQVKWVGGQINTTGLSGMDYMLSDSVETPPGVDDFYVEKLIRLPDDYICYVPRGDTPPVGPLPCSENGFVTFGCFNNPTKINPVIIEQWARLLHRVPASRLFLKGSQYDSEDMVRRITEQFEGLGISRDRLIIEERSPHVELLDCYNRVDVALDPWPYSGGLTTCEAMLMGVPVVTLPGPTFAGRHSATHLVNAGLREFVVDDWDAYCDVAASLAKDPDRLAELRRTLRGRLQKSPVCDAHRFARNLNIALRAIWQRHCRGEEPAALTFSGDAQARFDGEEEAVAVSIRELANPRQRTPERRAPDFDWTLPRQVVAIDCGGKLFNDPGFDTLLQTGAFAVVGFDPASRPRRALRESDDFQFFRHVALGDGQPATLFACLDPDLSGLLEPLPQDRLPGRLAQGATVLTKLPIGTVALDGIDGLEHVDWLVIDEHCDTLVLLRAGERVLGNSLVVQLRVLNQPRYAGQPSLAEVVAYVTAQGFELYRMDNPCHVPANGTRLDGLAGTALEAIDLLFVPSAARRRGLPLAECRLLGCILQTVYGITDLPFELLRQHDPALAEAFRLALPGTAPSNPEPAPRRRPRKAEQTASATEESCFRLPGAPHMSAAERILFLRSLEQATRYFEFGAGGSTVWAVRQGLEAFGVESDTAWVEALRDALGSRCRLQAVDIGPTGDWGMPLSRDCAERFPLYSQAIDDYDTPFDLVLVDGRFRVACVLRAIAHLLRHPAGHGKGRLFIHDFWNRPQYHVVLPYLEEVERAESAGLFTPREGIDLTSLEALWIRYAREPA